MSSLRTVMEKVTLSNLKNLTSNQYLIVTIVKGDVQSAIAYSRSIGFLTFGISRRFTAPYVSVEGLRTPENEACLNRLRRGLPCTVKNSLRYAS